MQGLVGGHVADHAAVRRRTDHAAGRLGAKSEGEEAGPYAGRRTGGRAAGRMAGVDRIDRGPRFARGELGGHRLAQHDRAG